MEIRTPTGIVTMRPVTPTTAARVRRWYFAGGWRWRLAQLVYGARWRSLIPSKGGF